MDAVVLHELKAHRRLRSLAGASQEPSQGLAVSRVVHTVRSKYIKLFQGQVLLDGAQRLDLATHTDEEEAPDVGVGAMRNSSSGRKFGESIGFTPPAATTSSTLRASMGRGSKGRSGEAEATQSTASTRPDCNISHAMLVMTPVHARFNGRFPWGTRTGRSASVTP
eukprot:CAMPEP_0180792662 /NCGR_PEP_ID=MMETSP1038_2-20121128/54539_1 /TAXON_ID=632150 /ORGANISM="Azadinium spinosum, Strain 3D9" /LENGTH=165 /DNA_ID=CAMNT_0022831037 /DNA_START=220 /DNA_END=715 /DNA_ORIENTATION=+